MNQLKKLLTSWCFSKCPSNFKTTRWSSQNFSRRKKRVKIEKFTQNKNFFEAEAIILNDTINKKLKKLKLLEDQLLMSLIDMQN